MKGKFLGSSHQHVMLFFSIGILFVATLVLKTSAQSDKTKLQNRKAKLEQEIIQMNRELEETKKNKSANLNQLVLINKKINKREELIRAIEQEVGGISGQVDKLSDTIYRLTTNLKGLKNEYARLIYSTYRNRGAYDRMMFIFASRSFNQAYKRLKYLHQYSEYRQLQVSEISKTQRVLTLKKLDLEKRKSSKLTLKHVQEQERNLLAGEKGEKDTKIQNLTTQEKKLLKKLNDNEIALNRLQETIEALVAAEIKKANDEKARLAALAEANKKALALTERNLAKAKAEKKAKPRTKELTVPVSKTEIPKDEPIAKVEESLPVVKALPVSTNSMSSSAEEVALTGSFAGNKGHLPSPVDRGSIISSFGEHPHAEFNNIKIKNNGIDIVSSAGSTAKVVFDGEVSSVLFIANLNYVVIVRHGDYLTVYSNLQNVTVKKGDKVKTRQALGTISTSEGETKSRLHFELWQGTMVQNPSGWLNI